MSTIRITDDPIADPNTDATSEELGQIRTALGLVSADAGNGLRLRANGLFGGTVVVAMAAENVSGHTVLRINSDGKLAYASADQLTHRFSVAGVAVGAAVMGDDATVQCADVITHNGWSWTPNAAVFLGLNGALTQSVPPSAQFVMVIGVAVSATRLAIGIQPPIVLS